MRVTLKELMQNLGIPKILAGYETDEYQYYDDEKGITASAEARMDSLQDHLEVEVQFLYDEPKEDKPPVEQIMLMKVKPKVDEKWTPYYLLVKGDEIHDKFPGWEEGACAFYIAVVLSLKRGEMPDIDALIDEHLDGEAGRAARGRRGGGRKNPKFKPPTRTLGMKQGM